MLRKITTFFYNHGYNITKVVQFDLMTG